MRPYSSEDGPLITSTLSAAAFMPRPCTRGMPLCMTEPSRLVPKPRFMMVSCVLARVLPWVTPLTLASASSRLRGRWSRITWAGTTLTTCGISSTGAVVRRLEASGVGW